MLTRDITRSITSNIVKGLIDIGGLLSGLVMWCRFDTGITVTGSGVSQWDDVSGQGNHLKQGTDTDRPNEEVDGSILFDGVDDYLKADPFRIDQPGTIYILGKQITWTDNDNWYDGDTPNTGRLHQATLTPQIAASADTESATVSLALDTYGVIAVVFDGASSVLQLDNGTPVESDFGADNLDGFTLGAAGGGGSLWSNIQVKETLVYSEAHTTSQLTAGYDYLIAINAGTAILVTSSGNQVFNDGIPVWTT